MHTLTDANLIYMAGWEAELGMLKPFDEGDE